MKKFGKQFKDETKKPDFDNLDFEMANLDILEENETYHIDYLWVNKDYGFGHSVSVIVPFKDDIIGIYLPSHVSNNVIEDFLKDEEFIKALHDDKLYLTVRTYEYETKGKKPQKKVGYSCEFFAKEDEEDEK